MTSPCLYPTGQKLVEDLAWGSEDLSDGRLPDVAWSACDVPRTAMAFHSLTLAGKGPPFADWPDHFEVRKLLTWGIFNPFGPTVSWLGLVPVPEEGLLLLVHRMRNPFLSETTVFGALDAKPQPSPELLRQLVTEIFARNGTQESRLIKSLPTYVRLDEPEFIDIRLAGAVFRLAYQAEIAEGGRPGSVSYCCQELLQHGNRPWELASSQWSDGLDLLKRLEEESGCSLNGLVTDENYDLEAALQKVGVAKPDDENLFGLWISLAADRSHASATEEAIDEAWLNSQLVQQSFPLNEFTTDQSDGPEAFPQTADDYSWLGCMFFDLGRFDEAAAFENVAVVLEPDSAARRFARGRTLLKLSDPTGACAEFSLAADLEPHVGHYWAGYAIALLYAGREEEARPVYAEALALEPDLEKDRTMRAAWEHAEKERAAHNE